LKGNFQERLEQFIRQSGIKIFGIAKKEELEE